MCLFSWNLYPRWFFVSYVCTHKPWGLVLICESVPFTFTYSIYQKSTASGGVIQNQPTIDELGGKYWEDQQKLLTLRLELKTATKNYYEHLEYMEYPHKNSPKKATAMDETAGGLGRFAWHCMSLRCIHPDISYHLSIPSMLLMVQKSCITWHVWAVKNKGIFTISTVDVVDIPICFQGWKIHPFAGFLEPSTTYHL